MSGISRPRGRRLRSGDKAKGKGKDASHPSSSQQRNIDQCMTSPISTPSPPSGNASVPLGTSSVNANILLGTSSAERTSTPQYSQPNPPHIESETSPHTEESNDHNSQTEQFIPFGDPTLPGPHNMHLPWGMDLSDNKVWIYTLKG